ncbi:hypothetical protein L0337_10760 [candidate division KSB1 bacterium]|nr:hypothetical protein [candidate division KSB1 bacterium]
MENNWDIEIRTGPPDAEALQQAIEAWRPKAEFAIFESLTDVSFPVPRATAINLAAWPKGRIFAPTFELRWEKNGADFRSVLAKEISVEWSNAGLADLFLPDSEVAGVFFGRENQSVYLWPENDMRLGRRLRYECLEDQRGKNQKNVMLEVKLYRDAHGRLIFWRYTQMRWTND